MRKYIKFFIVLFLISSGALICRGFVFAESGSENHVDHDEHEDHDEQGDHEKHDEHDEHEEHEEHNEHEEQGDHGEHEDHEEESPFGAGKAILEVKDNGRLFKLSHIAIETLSIESTVVSNVSTGKSIELPTSSLVYYQEKIGVFKKRESWFELVEVKVITKGKFTSIVKIYDVKKTWEIVSKGAALLRIAHLQASGQGGSGHAH